MDLGNYKSASIYGPVRNGMPLRIGTLIVSARVLYDWPADKDISCVLDFLLLNT
jgi:hypothetical protein